MNIQSLSIMVPCGGHCMNNCKFCVSRMRDDESIFGKEIISAKNIPQSYIDRIKYVRDAGCDNMIITGTTEPQQNRPFINALLNINSKLDRPFYNIAIQTTGAGMDEKDIESLALNGINTLALSVASFNMERNWDIIQTPKAAKKLSIEQLVGIAKANSMNVRVCLNLTDEFNLYFPKYIFQWANERNVDQLTFRKIYRSGRNTEQDKWIIQHSYNNESYTKIVKFIKEMGTPIRILPFGATLYDCMDIGVVVDEDCMAKNNLEDMRYAILRPNNHLYSSWDLKGSLIY
jgi:wyosine [tRNA(Phe)-imidazoG37] synthetase (radical SAM superfamily)